MTAKEASQKAAKNVWVQLGTVLLVGLGSGAGGTTLLAQPRSDAEIRELAKDEVAAESRVTSVKIKNIEDDVKEIKGDMKEVLRRLPRPPG